MLTNANVNKLDIDKLPSVMSFLSKVRVGVEIRESSKILLPFITKIKKVFFRLSTAVYSNASPSLPGVFTFQKKLYNV